MYLFIHSFSSFSSFVILFPDHVSNRKHLFLAHSIDKEFHDNRRCSRFSLFMRISNNIGISSHCRWSSRIAGLSNKSSLGDLTESHMHVQIELIRQRVIPERFHWITIQSAWHHCLGKSRDSSRSSRTTTASHLSFWRYLIWSTVDRWAVTMRASLLSFISWMKNELSLWSYQMFSSWERFTDVAYIQHIVSDEKLENFVDRIEFFEEFHRRMIECTIAFDQNRSAMDAGEELYYW